MRLVEPDEIDLSELRQTDRRTTVAIRFVPTTAGERIMASQVETRTLVKWLLDHGFGERAGSATSHRQFISKEPNIAITKGKVS